MSWIISLTLTRLESTLISSLWTIPEIVTVNKCEELSYPLKSENVRAHSSNSIENATPLFSI